MNSRTRKKKYAMLVERDGERCRVCGRKPPEVELDIDHIDANNANNAEENLQFLCTPHNIQKDPRGKGRRKQRSDILEEPKPTSWESKKNIDSEPRFRHWLYERLKQGPWSTGHQGSLLLHEVINAGAEYARVSTMTVKRYLAKVCSSIGYAEIYHDDGADASFVRFRSGASMGLTADLLGDSK